MTLTLAQTNQRKEFKVGAGKLLPVKLLNPATRRNDVNHRQVLK